MAHAKLESWQQGMLLVHKVGGDIMLLHRYITVPGSAPDLPFLVPWMRQGAKAC